MSAAATGALAAKLDNIAADLLGLTTRLSVVEQRLQARERRPAGPQPWQWHDLSVEEYRRRLGQLGDWVDWLIRRYDIPGRRLPRCWWRHGSLIEELLALHVGWEQAYLDPAADPVYPTRWHEALDRAWPRIAAWSGCARTGQHSMPALTSGDGEQAANWFRGVTPLPAPQPVGAAGPEPAVAPATTRGEQ